MPERDLPSPPPYQPRPRRPFPWMPLAIVALGVLFLLLAVSVSFNVYILLRQQPDEMIGGNKR
jgi:hypothetical protein